MLQSHVVAVKQLPTTELLLNFCRSGKNYVNPSTQKIKSSMSIILQNGCWAMSDFENEMDDKLASSSQHHHYTCKKRNIIILNKISSSLSSNTIDFHIFPYRKRQFSSSRPRNFHTIINIAPLKFRKSTNDGQFYSLKTTILYKVVPRKFHIIINIAQLKIRKSANVIKVYPLKTTIF